MRKKLLYVEEVLSINLYMEFIKKISWIYSTCRGIVEGLCGPLGAPVPLVVVPGHCDDDGDVAVADAADQLASGDFLWKCQQLCQHMSLLRSNTAVWARPVGAAAWRVMQCRCTVQW